MEKYKEKIRKSITAILIGLVVLLALPLAYLSLLYLKLPVPYIQVSSLHEWIVLNGEILLTLLLYKIYTKDGWKASNTIYFFRDFFIANCIFAYPFIAFYTSRFQNVVPLLRTLRPYITLGYKVLLASTVVLIVYSVPHVNRFREWLRANLEMQRMQEEETQARRGARFLEKYPKLANTPLLGPIATKISEEGHATVIAFLVLAAIGLTLRLWNLDALPPTADETFHLVAAKAIFQGLPLNQTTYQRSLFTVTLPVVLSFKVFGMSLWSARFVGVFANILALFPLYLLGKKINKLVALTATGLFVLSPWMISVARIVREYAYYAFFFYLIAYVMVKFYEAVPNQLVLTRDYRQLFSWKNSFYIVILGFTLYYVVGIDPSSTFKLILIVYPVFGLLLLKKVDWRNPANILLILFLCIAGGVILGVLLVVTGGKYVKIYKQFNWSFLILFFDHPPQQWYYNRPLIAAILLAIAILATFIWDKRKFALPFISLTYVASQLSFALFKIKANKPRYAITTEFWHILVMAVGLVILFIVIDRYVKIKYKGWLWAGLLLLFWNIPQSLVPSTYSLPGIHPITYEHHIDIAPAYSYLTTNINDDDVLVTTTYIDRFSRWSGGLNAKKIIYYTYTEKDAAKDIFDAIETYACGWIALDYQRGSMYSKPVPLESFTDAGKQVTFLGWYGGVYLLRWCDR